ncbi:sodium-independent anion transporter, partial ['Osedax' symbiont bacterium Rs2_46_30_T18]
GLGIFAITMLFWLRKSFKAVLLTLGVGQTVAEIMAKTGPVFVIIVTITVTWAAQLVPLGVSVVGDIPRGLPSLALPVFSLQLWQQLLGSALLISVIGFVESVSVAQTLAAKKRQRISPDQELIGLGAANIASSVSGGFPVTGGFSRSVVNFDAGAKTPAAGAYTAVGIALATLFLTPLIYFLPKATLAATIIVAVLSLVDLGALKRTWQYSRSDFSAMLVTILLTLLYGVELGIVFGVSLSVLLYLYRTSMPHSAEVGLVAGTEHFRNIDRHKVETDEKILTLRIDESLYFINARYLQDRVYDLIAKNPQIEHFVLMCPAVNFIDASALESLEAINALLKDSAVKFHLSEVKGPVMDRLQRSHFIEQLSGEVFLSQYEAWRQLKSLNTEL